jgi:4'-phosphopantetheinyl transferase EntD
LLIVARPDSSSLEPIRSPHLEALFPGATVAVFRSGRLMGDAPLSGEEARFIKNAVPGRKAEFATGRACARAAIGALGRQAPTIPVGEGRQPVWPEGVSAAITHTRREQREFVAAVATLDHGGHLAVGIDAEVIQPLKDGVRDMLLVPDEIHMVEELPPGERDEGAIRVFSAKEAFYKAQYALTSSWVGFGDMRLTSLEGSGELVETGHLRALTIIQRPIRFHQVVHDGLVVSGVVVHRTADI